jgi:hypothetical protein
MKKSDLSPPARSALKVFFGFNPGQKLSFNTPSRRTKACMTALEELILRGLVQARFRNDCVDAPIDYEGLPGAYEIAQTISNADVKRGSFPVTED